MKRRWLGVGVAVVAAGVVALVIEGRHRRTPTRVYVTNEEAGTVTVLDGSTDQVVASIPVGKRPRGIQLSADGRSAYVALSGSPRAAPGQKDDDVDRPADKSADGIGVIDTTTNKLVRVIVSGSDPEQFALGTDGKTLYVANEDAAEISVVDIATNAVVRRVAVGKEPEGVTLGPGGATVWVTSESDDKVYVIDTRTNDVVARIEVGARPRAIAFARTGARAFVTLENAASLAIIDATTRKVERTVKFEGLNVRPMGVVVAPDDRVVYVTTGRGRTVLAVDANDGSVRTRIDAGERPWGIAMTREGDKLYTANGTSDDVSVIEIAQGRAVVNVKVGGRPWGVAVYP